ncbi:solute carrier family 22 member 6-like [Octopus bimaculoides]|uniref:solute carrier family 22 member 6-like n=1 Tax=Octopus bimaculoides TaxID=37653 RepID=UPI0022DF436C|nr:solute carrier family 22 member 6-like [Octopus bimaculoides]
MVSGLLAPCLIEKFGRKPMRVSSNILLIVLNLIAAYSPSYWLFTTMRFLIGGAREAFLLSSFTLACELYPKERRIIMSCTFMIIWAAHNSSLGLIAYMLKDFSWNTLLLFTAVVSVYFPVDYLVVNTASLNGVLLMAEVLIGSIYISYSVMALLEIVTAASYMAIAERFGHKISLQAWKTLAAVSFFSVSMIKILAEKNEMAERVIPVLYFLAVAGLNAGSGGDYIYTSELFPTQLRSVGNGFATTVMRAACMAAPFLKLLAMAAPWGPGIILGTGCIIASILLQVFLPETRNRNLLQTIDDVKMMEKENKTNDVKIQDAT